ncbi:MAG: [FeFe] hydrogenase H-cluster maturation GTPase HydF [Verrucomicrobiota bacterium]|nr:[FeFe] hydrogenase H-cluster maturation GTPase HydF [Verrucomicrobiota bacterium]
MQKTPKGMRLQIGIFGRRNVGKSSFLNTVTRQDVSIVSEIPGTTTDPVEKAMELLPIGPVLFIDTAGIDDIGALGEARICKSRKVFERTDVAVIIVNASLWDSFEDNLIEEFKDRNIPLLIVFNKVDIDEPQVDMLDKLEELKIEYAETDSLKKIGFLDFKKALIASLPPELINPAGIIGDLIEKGDTIILVVPIDMEAPKGRIILPQVQVIRDILDNNANCIVVKENQLKQTIENLKKPPVLVITDSQVFKQVAKDTPESIALTSFSIVFARFKGDLDTFTEGAKRIKELMPGDRVLISEACTHHPIGNDIGRIQIPELLNKHVGGKLHIDITEGHDFSEDIKSYKLIIHCGACMFNKQMLLTRILQSQTAGVPITNYGITLAYLHGIHERALKPFKSK